MDAQSYHNIKRQLSFDKTTKNILAQGYICKPNGLVWVIILSFFDEMSDNSVVLLASGWEFNF